MYYADAAISWNCIFGANSQESHWKNFVSQVRILQKSNLKPFSSRLLAQHLGNSESAWGGIMEDHDWTLGVKIETRSDSFYRGF